MNSFGEFLYQLRKEKGMTQAELADALGVTNKAVSKWETGEAMPETALLKPLARIFGVTVDELLDGERADGVPNTDNEEPKATVSDEDIDELVTRRIKQHLFTRGHDPFENKTVLDRICGAVCAAVFSLGVMAYLILGALADLWEPYWVIIPVCALSCGIIGSIFDVCNKQKRERKLARGENPVVGAICGIVMLCCMITYLLLGVFSGLWHPMWLIIVCGGLVCGIIGALGSVWADKKRKSKEE